jgi:hypothetical protein
MALYKGFFGFSRKKMVYQFPIAFSKGLYRGFPYQETESERGRNPAVSRQKQPSGYHKAGDIRPSAVRYEAAARGEPAHQQRASFFREDHMWYLRAGIWLKGLA